MNGHANHSSYTEKLTEKLEAFRKSDAERDALVAEVIRQYEELQLKYTEKCDDYSNEVESRRMWQNKASSHERALAEHKQASGSNSFVLVVLDGDGAVFQDYLLAMGKDGGSDAAHQLHSEIKNDLKSTYPDASVDDWNVVVQVVLNLQGLANKLLSCGIVSNPNDVFAFARAFGLAQPLFSFIDVGIGKERADHKIRETLRVFLPNAQCKHVYFGPCNDNGYVVVLERYKRDYASRLTLIETRSCEQGFVDLGFKRVAFPRIFRTENLPAKPTFMPMPPVLPQIHRVWNIPRACSIPEPSSRSVCRRRIVDRSVHGSTVASAVAGPVPPWKTVIVCITEAIAASRSALSSLLVSEVANSDDEADFDDEDDYDDSYDSRTIAGGVIIARIFAWWKSRVRHVVVFGG